MPQHRIESKINIDCFTTLYLSSRRKRDHLQRLYFMYSISALHRVAMIESFE